MDRTMQKYHKLVQKRKALSEIKERMFKRVEQTEEAFRSNFSQIKLNLIQVDLDAERVDLDELLRDPNNLTKDSFERLKLEYERKVNEVRETCESFKYFEFDLRRNKYKSSAQIQENFESASKFLGELELYNEDLLKSVKSDQIENVVVCTKSPSQRGIGVWNLNTHTLVKTFQRDDDDEHVETWCLAQYENDKIISGGSDR
jgi:hypothetical protein